MGPGAEHGQLLGISPSAASGKLYLARGREQVVILFLVPVFQTIFLFLCPDLSNNLGDELWK